MATFEFRKLFRADVVVKVEYETKGKTPLGGTAFSQNLSQTGINLIANEQLAKDTELNMKIYLYEKEEPVLASGVVVWQAPCSFIPKSERKYYSTGILIRNMSSQDAIRQSDFVKDCLVEKSEKEKKKIIKRLEGLKEEGKGE